MQGLLARINQQKNPNAGSKVPSRSTSIASSMDDDEQHEQSNSDESQSQPTSTTPRPKVRKDKKAEEKKALAAQAAEVKPKIKSRIDTNMVKLKLLDATRKAIIDKTKKQYTTSSTNTEVFKTKLCKDQSVENQVDLLNPCDQSTETEVELVAVRAQDGTLIITSTCAVNTEKLSTSEVACQTTMPRSSVGFSNRFANARKSIQYAVDDDELTNYESEDHSEELLKIEERLRSRKKLHRQRSSPRSKVEFIESGDSKPAEKESIRKEEKDVDSEYEDSIHEDDQRKDHKRTEKTEETFNSWHGLDVPQEKAELPKSFFTDGPTPWSNFEDLVLGQRFLNARLNPPPRDPRVALKQVAWSDAQARIVAELLKESRNLMEMFDQVALLLGPDIKLHNVSDVEEFSLPPSNYRDELMKSCESLEARLSNSDMFSNSKSDKLLPE